jgi:hypothetical protein
VPQAPCDKKSFCFFFGSQKKNPFLGVQKPHKIVITKTAPFCGFCRFWGIPVQGEGRKSAKICDFVGGHGSQTLVAKAKGIGLAFKRGDLNRVG